jgi:3-phosphoshikimate 1-carboxyvinyltransferase
MANLLLIEKKLKQFDKKISVSGDKSISIRWILFASLASGLSKAQNLLISDDVLTAINVVKKFGIKVVLRGKFCNVYGNGVDGFKFKNNLTLDAKNSGTLGRLILGFLVNTPKPIKLVGDKSLSKRDFKRISDPLSKFGAILKLKNKKNLPLTIRGSKNLKPIRYLEEKGSAQCKSAVIFAGLRTKGITTIRAKKSRNHTELMCKYLGLPISVKNKRNYDEIKVSKVEKIKPFNYKIPSDISSSAFFIVLAVLSKNSKLLIKNVNINPSRLGIINILKKMGASIIFKNQKTYKGEKVADIKVKGGKVMNSINCPSKLNSTAIDEFLVIFLVAAKAKGISYFRDLAELNQKESPRLKWGAKILDMMGVKNVVTHNSIKIYGNPQLEVKNNIVIKNYLKDHRVFMTSVIAAFIFGGKWKIHDKDSIKTSFPDFLKIISELKN